MARIKKDTVPEITTKFLKESSILVDGFEINKGDMIKVSGQYGGKFRFDSLTTNLETGAQWVDCFEVNNGIAFAFRSFFLKDIKRIPQRGKRAKRVIV